MAVLKLSQCHDQVGTSNKNGCDIKGRAIYQGSRTNGILVFDQTMVKHVCAVEKQMVFPSSGSLLEVLVHVVMAVLAIGEDVALTMLRQRVIKHKQQDAAATSVLAGVDEAAHVLDPQSEQEKMVKQEDSHTEFENEWKQNRQRTRGPKAQAKSKSKRPHKSSAPPSTLPASVETMDQKDLKQYMPPKACLWKNRSAGSWDSKVEPFGGCSKAICAHGGNEALRQCIASAWKDHCPNEGIGFEDCPMNGLPEISDARFVFCRTAVHFHGFAFEET